MIDLSGQTVLLTGAAKGIGAATAEVLLAAGARVFAGYNRTPGALTSLKTQHGDLLAMAQADLSDPLAVDRLWEDAVAWGGRITAVINNAAVMSSTTVADDLDAWRTLWRETMAVNVEAVADLCRHAIDHFDQMGGGSIVNIASRAAFRGDLPDAMHYAASKGAVVALTRSIAKGYADKGIYAYCVAPGWVGTERIRPKLDAPGNEHLTAEIPMGDAAPPQQVGNIVAFLLSGLASHTTGGTFDINGASYFH